MPTLSRAGSPSSRVSAPAGRSNPGPGSDPFPAFWFDPALLSSFPPHRPHHTAFFSSGHEATRSPLSFHPPRRRARFVSPFDWNPDRAPVTEEVQPLARRHSRAAHPTAPAHEAEIWNPTRRGGNTEACQARGGRFGGSRRGRLVSSPSLNVTGWLEADRVEGVWKRSYYASISLGTPAKTFEVVLDTGSAVSSPAASAFQPPCVRPDA